jgi:NADH-quinone oxidoreductase subunit L
VNLDVILLASSEAAAEIPVVHPAAAEGIFTWLWLVIALPLAGAVLLLLGGALAKGAMDRVGHWIGTATAVGSFAVSLALFVSLLGRGEEERQIGQHLFTWFEVGGLHVGMDLIYDPLSALSCC